jgi:hypothetical protein
MEIVFAIVVIVVLLSISVWIGNINRDNRWRDDRIDSHRQRLAELEQRLEEMTSSRGER